MQSPKIIANEIGRSVQTDFRSLINDLAKYRGSRVYRSIFEIAVTVFGLLTTWIIIWFGLEVGFWPVLIFAVPAGGFLVRLFMIQHDCGHGSYFRRRWTNDWTGRIISIFTFTPYDFWKRSHAAHHASSGNLDRRGIGDITTLTVEEYEAITIFGRLQYRLYRHPVVMFGLGPAYLFLLQHRLPVGYYNDARAWISAMGTNVAIALLVGGMMWIMGPIQFLQVHLPIVLIAASIGVWLFYVQHQFEETSWAREEAWNVHEYALHGSSYYELPVILRWFTANIGMHHIHHLCTKIPFYKLPAALRDHPEFREIGRVTLSDSLKCIPLTLWNEHERRLMTFSEYARRKSSVRL